MENSKPYRLIKKVFLGALMLGLIIFLQSCAKKIAFQTSTIVPAAEGTLKVTKDNNNNYVIHMNLSNLAQPQRLQPARQVYVVWMESEQQRVKNIGQISSSTGILSKRLRASFETVSPIKPTRIFITAEDDASVQYPGMQILTTDNL